MAENPRGCTCENQDEDSKKDITHASGCTLHARDRWPVTPQRLPLTSEQGSSWSLTKANYSFPRQNQLLPAH